MTISEDNMGSGGIGIINGLENAFHFHPWMNALLHTFRKVKNGHLLVSVPDGTRYQFGCETGDGHKAEMHFYSYDAPKQILKNLDIGFAESYITGQWHTPDLLPLLLLLLENEKELSSGLTAGSFAKFSKLYRRLFKQNNLRNSKKNIEYHYDLGNDFYQLWLDPSMTYSSALYKSDTTSLSDAQKAKYQRIAEICGLKSGHQVLEIGCGWGGFAEIATEKEGVHITGLTLSSEQLSYANTRMENQSRSDQANLLLQDYRSHTGAYDSIVSIEMFEAVGEKNWPRFFQTIYNNLKSDGKAAVQVITISEDRFDRYRGKQDFIQKHIFPGGFLPTKQGFIETARKQNLKATIREEFGGDYARTLNEWHRDFDGNWQTISRLGYDEKFKRKWEMYLKYCEAGFIHETIDVVIFEVSKA